MGGIEVFGFRKAHKKGLLSMVRALMKASPYRFKKGGSEGGNDAVGMKWRNGSAFMVF